MTGLSVIFSIVWLAAFGLACYMAGEYHERWRPGGTVWERDRADTVSRMHQDALRQLRVLRQARRPARLSPAEQQVVDQLETQWGVG